MRQGKSFIREWRMAKGVTGADLARGMGIERSSISRLESGERRMTLEYMNKAAQFLGIHPEDLMRQPPADMSAGSIDTKFLRPESRRLIEVGSQVSVAGVRLLVDPPFKLVGVVSDMMVPTIQPGDYVAVKTTETAFGASGLYLISTSEGEVVARLQPVPSGLKVSFDNPNYSGYEITKGKLKILGTILLRVARV